MQFGTFLLMPSPSARPSEEVYSRGIEVAQAAEELGYRSIWLAEHHFSNYGYLSRPLILATHIAAKTTRLRVGTAVVVLPLHHPLVVAEEIATADLLSGGRLDLGLGRGYQRYEFERLGMDLDESRPRWEEAVEILMKAFTEESFSFQGQYYSFPETTVLPKPLQKPFPPVWVVGQSPQSIDAAVRRGFNVLTGGAAFSIDRIVEIRKLFDEAVAKYKPVITPSFSVQSKVYVADDEEEAQRMAQEGLWNMRVALSLRLNKGKVVRGRVTALPMEGEPSIQELLEQFLMFGTVEQCIQRVQRLRDEVGIDHLNCDFWHGDTPHDKVLRSMERFASEVIPHFQESILVGDAKGSGRG